MGCVDRLSARDVQSRKPLGCTPPSVLSQPVGAERDKLCVALGTMATWDAVSLLRKSRYVRNIEGTASTKVQREVLSTSLKQHFRGKNKNLRIKWLHENASGGSASRRVLAQAKDFAKKHNAPLAVSVTNRLARNVEVALGTVRDQKVRSIGIGKDSAPV